MTFDLISIYEKVTFFFINGAAVLYALSVWLLAIKYFITRDIDNIAESFYIHKPYKHEVNVFLNGLLFPLLIFSLSPFVSAAWFIFWPGTLLIALVFMLRYLYDRKKEISMNFKQKDQDPWCSKPKKESPLDRFK